MKKFRIVVSMLVLAVVATGCSSAIQAVKHRQLKVSAEVKGSVFLDAETLAQAPSVYVRMTNNSAVPRIDFGQALKNRLQGYGITVTDSPSEADYIVSGNLLYLGKDTEGSKLRSILKTGAAASAVGSVAGAIGDASYRGSSLRGALGVGALTGIGAGAGDAVVGAIYHVDEIYGVVDLEIREGPARKAYQTRVIVRAVQTRLNLEEAIEPIIEALASKSASIFKPA